MKNKELTPEQEELVNKEILWFIASEHYKRMKEKGKEENLNYLDTNIPIYLPTDKNYKDSLKRLKNNET